MRHLFLADYEQKYGIYWTTVPTKYNEQMYLDVCRNVSPPLKAETRTVVAEEGFKFEVSERDHNYKNISNFYELKWEWKMR